MKLIEGLKRKQLLLKKAEDLRDKVRKNCAHYNYETPSYKDPEEKIKQWTQAHEDLMQEIIKLRIAIQKTNLGTQVTIELGNKPVTKSIAEWIIRRDSLAKLDEQLWKSLNTHGMKEQKVKGSKDPESVTEVIIIQNFNAEERDIKIDMYTEEPSLIDSRLEVVNAITDLIGYGEEESK